MSIKLYLLLDIVNPGYEEVVKVLRNKPGITSIEVLEGPPDILVVIKARTRRQAANYMINTLNSVDDVLEHFSMLPVAESSKFGIITNTKEEKNHVQTLTGTP